MNKIEQIEQHIEVFKKEIVHYDKFMGGDEYKQIDVDDDETILEALELSLEIAKGEKHAHTMEQLQTMIISGIAGFLEKQAAEFRIAEKNPVIPTPKEVYDV